MHGSQGTCAMHLHDALACCSCMMHLHNALAHCSCTMLLHYALQDVLVQCICTMHLHGALARCTCTMHFHQALARCTCMMQPRNPCLLFFFCLPLLSRLLHDFRRGLLTWESIRMCNQPTRPRSCCTCPAAPQGSAPRTQLHLRLCRARQKLTSRYLLRAKPKP